MRSDVTISATLVSLSNKAYGIRVSRGYIDGCVRDNGGTRDVNEDVGVVLGTEQTSDVRTPVRGVGTVTTVSATGVTGHLVVSRRRHGRDDVLDKVVTWCLLLDEPDAGEQVVTVGIQLLTTGASLQAT